MKNWKKALQFALCLLPIGLIGGWFAVEMTLTSVPPDLLETAPLDDKDRKMLEAIRKEMNDPCSSEN